MEEVNADHLAHGKESFDGDDEPLASTKKRRDNTSMENQFSRRRRNNIL